MIGGGVVLCWVGLGLGYDDGFGDPWLSQMGEERETANTTTLSIYLVVDNKEGGYAAEDFKGGSGLGAVGEEGTVLD